MKSFLKVFCFIALSFTASVRSADLSETNDFWSEDPNYKYLYFNLPTSEIQRIFKLINEGWEINLIGAATNKNTNLKMRLRASHLIESPIDVITNKNWFTRNSFGHHKNYIFKGTTQEFIDLIDSMAKKGFRIAFYGYDKTQSHKKVSFVK